MKKRKVVDIVDELIVDFIKKSESVYELVDIEFVKEGPHRYLRVYMDKEGGISLDDCSEISHYLDDQLDRLDPVEENYFLEVSSPGIERPLKKEADYSRFAGQLVELKLYFPYEGQKIFEGTLKGLIEGEVAIEKENSTEVVRIPLDKIASAKLLFRF
jgi:ribosome maturation factor RimP